MVGGAAAQFYGAERLTNDTDCVVRQGRENLDRLAVAMRELNARLRVEGMTDDQARQLPVQIDSRTLGGMESSTWVTDAGAFDVLRGLARAGKPLAPYEELTDRQQVMEQDGVEIRLAGLADIIAAKEHANLPKDHEALPSCGRCAIGSCPGSDNSETPLEHPDRTAAQLVATISTRPVPLAAMCPIVVASRSPWLRNKSKARY